MSTPDADETRRMLAAFIDLARRPHLEPADQEQRIRLARVLRTCIDGARPGHDHPKARGNVSIQPEVADKLRAVGLGGLPHSSFSRHRKPAFLDTYYEGAVDEIASAPTQPPAQVVDASGTRIELPELTLDLWNVGGDLPNPETPDVVDVSPDPSSSSRPRPSAPPPRGDLTAPPPGPESRHATSVSSFFPRQAPAVVHLLTGSKRQGYVEAFDPDSGIVCLIGRGDHDPHETIALKDVLVIFFGRSAQADPSPKLGTPVEVTLVNSRRLTGFARDYAPQPATMTVVPASDRGGVDRVWIPAWAIQAVALSEPRA